MRAVSDAFKAALFAEQTDEVIVALVTVTHPDLDAPKLFSSNATERVSTDPLLYATMSRGQQYDFLPFDLTLPEDGPETPPAMMLDLVNVSRELVPLLRSTTKPAKVTIELVLASDPDNVEAVFPNFDLKGARGEAEIVSLSLTISSLVDEGYPAGTFNPAFFPGLF